MNSNNHTTGPLPPPPPAPSNRVPAPAVPPRQPQQIQAPGTSGILYDMSSFDPLQAQAFQLSASAGLTGLSAGQQIAAAAPPLPANVQQQKQPTGGGVASGAIQASQQQQQHLFLFQPQAQQQQHQQQPSSAASASAVVPHGASITAQSQPTIQPLLSPASAANAQAMLLPALVSHFPPHLLAAQGIVIPQQYLDAANNAVAANAVPDAVRVEQQFVPLAAASEVGNSHKRRGQESGANASKKQFIAPSMVSSSTNGEGVAAVYPAALSTTMGTAAASAHGSSSSFFAASDPLPPKEASEAELAKMTPAERRRYDRNLREQQRSYRISQQIKELRDILVDSKFPFKPNKYSILLSVVDYIKQLQSRAIMLDTEHSKLIKTIRETNAMINSGNAPTSTDGESDTFNAASTADSGSDSEMLFVKGIDYRSVFDQCPAALGIAALDGRILECNMEFQTLLGFSERNDVLKQSLFNLVQNHQDIFRAMAQMLKNAEEPLPSPSSPLEGGPIRIPDTDAGGNRAVVPTENNNNNNEEDAPTESAAISRDRFWTGPVTSKLNVELLMNITLALGDNGTPKFFSCSVTSTGDLD